MSNIYSKSNSRRKLNFNKITLNWKYVPYVIILGFTIMVTLVRIILVPQLGALGQLFWFIFQFVLLTSFWYCIQRIARFLDKRISFTSGFSRRVLLQIFLSLLIIIPPLVVAFYFAKPHMPYYFTTEFTALVCILIFSLIILMNAVFAAGIFFRNWQTTVLENLAAEEAKKNTEMELLQIKEKQAAIEMRALRAQMNPHFIFNSLNSINKYILKNDHINASRYLTRFAKLIRLILDNSNNKEIALSDEIEALRLYIEMESLRFTNKFSYDIILDDSVSVDTLQVPPLIIQPYVENAIWHGLLHKDSGGILTVRFKKTSDNMLQCTIEDNGIGRAKASEVKSKSANANKSLGMKLTQERLNILNVHSSLNASIEIIDLLDEHQQGVGTKVIVTIPI